MSKILQHPTFVRLSLVIWMIVITVTLLQSSGRPVVGAPAPRGAPSPDRELLLMTGHMVAFGVMLILLWGALRPASHALLVALITCWFYSGATELLQRLVPDRGASLDDFAVNCLVSGIAALVIYWRSRWKASY